MSEQSKREIIQDIQYYIIAHPGCTDTEIIEHINKNGIVKIGKNGLSDKTELGKLVEQLRALKKRSVYTHASGNLSWSDDREDTEE